MTFVPIKAQSVHQKCDVKRVLQSCKTYFGMPKWQTTWSKNKEATTGVVRPPSPRPKEQGIRHVNLENLSTATNKPVYPWQTGKGPIKSMVHCSNLTYGMGRGCNKPEGAEVQPFTHWHVLQQRTKDVTCWAKRGHQTRYAQNTFQAPKCVAVDVQCSSCIIRWRNPREPGKTNCKPVCNTQYNKLKPAVVRKCKLSIYGTTSFQQMNHFLVSRVDLTCIYLSKKRGLNTRGSKYRKLCFTRNS